MNRVYKIVWSKAKNAYVVTSELAKNHTRSASGKAVKAALTVAVGMGVLMGGYAADAAAKDIVDKGGNLIAYDISPANEGTNIAVGKNAKVFIGGGTQESMLSFGETIEHTLTGMHIHSNNAAKQNLPAGMAVGTNTYARTGSIQMGDHTLEKNQIAIGDTTADKLRQFGVASTTLGTNSYTGGGAADRLLASVGRPGLFMEMCVSYLAASEMLSIVENLNDAGVGVLSGLVRKMKRK